MSPALAIAMVAVSAAYVWRWRGAAGSVPIRRMGAFVGGMVALWIAVGSPLAQMEHAHLTAHMLQHLIIMTIAAPLILIGEPVLVFLGGDRARRRWSVHPVLCWLAGTGVVIVWHVPALFAVGMRWHGVQHATFLAGGLLFWLPVLRPWPTVWRWSRWTIPLYLFLATMPCDALSAFLAFCDRVMYPHHASMHDALAHHGALADQARAGALMWFWVTIAYLVPAAVVTMRLVASSGRQAARSRVRHQGHEVGANARRPSDPRRSGAERTHAAPDRRGGARGVRRAGPRRGGDRRIRGGGGGRARDLL